MTERSFHPTGPLVRKLEALAVLTDEERAGLEQIPMLVDSVGADEVVVREGDRASRSCLILDGFTATYKLTGNGRRQITAFGLAGDIPDLESLHLKVLDCGIVSITPCRLGFIQHDTLRQICQRFPNIASAFWRETLVEGAIFREWVLNVGQRNAVSGMAHILCELVRRLDAVGLVEDWTCSFPITQTELGDALGISSVHANRVLQDLRAENLISLQGRVLKVRNWQRLAEIGDFDPTYLHLI